MNAISPALSQSRTGRADDSIEFSLETCRLSNRPSTGSLAALLMKSTLFKSFITVALSLVCCWSWAEDWPQYRGPRGDGISNEKITTWPGSGLKRLWKAETPGGFSSFVAGGGHVFTIVSRNAGGAPIAMCIALDATTGKELWAAPTGVANFPGGGDAGAEGNNGGDGPRSTPAVKGDRVYVYSADMVLHCLDASSGKPVWKKEITREFNGKNISWKSAMSPVIDGDILYIAGGGPGES